MSKIQERIKQYIDAKGISVREFCRKINTSSSFLSKDAEISSDKVLNIVNAFPEISIEWLITGEGNMLKCEIDHSQPIPNLVSEELLVASQKQADDLINMLKQSQKQLDDVIKMYTQLLEREKGGGVAHRGNDARCADVG